MEVLPSNISSKNVSCVGEMIYDHCVNPDDYDDCDDGDEYDGKVCQIH